MANLFEGVALMSKEQLESARSSGSVTVAGETVPFNDSVLYLTEDEGVAVVSDGESTFPTTMKAETFQTLMRITADGYTGAFVTAYDSTGKLLRSIPVSINYAESKIYAFYDGSHYEYRLSGGVVSVEISLLKSGAAFRWHTVNIMYGDFFLFFSYGGVELNGDTIKDVCGALTGLGCYVENAAFAPEAYYPATGEYFTVEYGVYHIIGVYGCIENESIFAVVSSTMDGSGSAAVFEITEGTVKVVYGSLRS
ncbi:MAG: hypothetical protein IJB34_04465 [Clostridia bacterium]|nr:hypothetical protein [Clostridia bacterium]